ncbi:uncharacterized protein LOC134179420 isoform X2 [Corticium candelabrum]|uniref:uncharacterized protein LOC134179420 isoform X2 n=1 Tax=Corticium candelabrum TaxID=121492 RepID=UPI002E25B2E2|nr:uncharacterized protein LOC134179420 isoform X2 [Corticium candelabrum]
MFRLTYLFASLVQYLVSWFTTVSAGKTTSGDQNRPKQNSNFTRNSGDSVPQDFGQSDSIANSDMSLQNRSSESEIDSPALKRQPAVTHISSHLALGHPQAACYGTISVEMATQNILKIIVVPLDSEDTYSRQVTVRISWDNWISFSDVTATWHHHSEINSDSNCFIAVIPIPYGQPQEDSVIQFAVRYVNDDVEDWDNNDYHNYELKWINEPIEIKTVKLTMKNKPVRADENISCKPII